MNNAIVSVCLTHVQQTVARWSAVLRYITAQFQRLYYSDSVWLAPLCCRSWIMTMLVDLPANLLTRLQSVLSSAARSIAGLRRSAHHMTPLTVSTAYVLPSELSLNWRSLSTELFTGLRLVPVWSAEQRRCWHAVSELTLVVNFQLAIRCVYHSWSFALLLLAQSCVGQSSRWHYFCFIIDSVSAKT